MTSLPPLVPVPASLELSDGAPYVLAATTGIDAGADAATALSALLTARTGRSIDRGTGITLRVGGGGPAESYELTADAASVVITGADAAGLFYGVQTLGQLLTPHGQDWVVPAVHITDAPRFAYRGVMLDVARHFFDVQTVMAFIDRAAGLKFNALHLHLSDDQGWRIHLDSRPELTARASGTAVGGAPGGFYTKAEYREIVAYAASRHMIVVPEIDMPGHTHAVGLAYPELVEAPVITDHMREIVRDYGGEIPTEGVPYDGMAVGFSSLRVHEEATYDFIADVFGELAAMTPGPYLHFGGDEALGTDPADFAVFVERVSDLIAGLDKVPLAWHEAGSAAGLHPTTIGQYWGYVTPEAGMDDKARAFVRAGSRLILSPSDAIYLDMKPSRDFGLGLTWARGATSAERAYRWEPSTVIDGIEEEDILGIEAPLWSETVRTLDDIDALAFPRIAAAAEAGWSPASGVIPARTWESFRERVAATAGLWKSLGIGFTPLDGIDWPDGSETDAATEPS